MATIFITDDIDRGQEKERIRIIRKGIHVLSILDNGDVVLHEGNVIVEKEDVRVKKGNVILKGNVELAGNIRMTGNIELDGSVTSVGPINTYTIFNVLTPTPTLPHFVPEEP